LREIIPVILDQEWWT